MATTSNKKGDWDLSDEDDNWDDWGDAEDKNESTSSATGEVETISKHDIGSSQSSSNNKVSESGITTSTSNNGKTICEDIQSHTEQSTKSSWGLWSGKLTSVLSTATEGLGSITSTVNQGINQIIGVPDPEELARMNAAEEATKAASDSPKADAEPTETENDKEQPVFGLSLVSVTTLGSKVLNTGLDTLEGIGKKTMTILQENDPKLINKRKLLGLETEKPNLSAVLQEAKKDADQMEQSLRQLQLEKTKAQLCFDVLFENFCGLVHFEALEILSKESNLKLQTLLNSVSGNALTDLQETINEVKELLEMEDLESESDGDYDGPQLNERLLATIEDAELAIMFDDIVNNWTHSLDWLDSPAATNADIEEAYAKSITSLSEACALEICKLHKIAELLLVKENHSTANEVDGIVQLCKQFHAHLQGLTQRFAASLSAKGGDDAKERVNALFSELLVAVQHIEKAYKLFMPILQIGAV